MESDWTYDPDCPLCRAQSRGPTVTVTLDDGDMHTFYCGAEDMLSTDDLTADRDIAERLLDEVATDEDKEGLRTVISRADQELTKRKAQALTESMQGKAKRTAETKHKHSHAKREGSDELSEGGS